MIVDDTRVLTNLYCNFLSKLGYESSGAYTGLECLEKLTLEKPDLILLDIMMEPVDGWKTLEMIKENPETEGIPVVMMTAKAPVPNDFVDYGDFIDGYVMKPVKPSELQSIINMVIDRRKKAAESILLAKEFGACEEKQRRLFDLSIQHDVLMKLKELLYDTYSAYGNGRNFKNLFEKELGSIDCNLEDKKEELFSLKTEIGLL